MELKDVFNLFKVKIDKDINCLRKLDDNTYLAYNSTTNSNTTTIYMFTIENGEPVILEQSTLSQTLF